MPLFKQILAGTVALGLSVTVALGLSVTVALADVVAVVSAKSPIASVSKTQLAEIFLGKTSHFPDGTQAVPIDQVEGARARDEFYAKIAGKTAAQLKAYWSKIIFTGRGEPPMTVSDGNEMKKRLSENPAAIGYLDKSLVDDSVKVVF